MPRTRERHNLPVQRTRLIGREQALGTVRDLLLGSKGRLVTLTGPGGAGKSRLALQVAAELVDAVHDGVWLVELAALADPSLVPQTVALALGLREQPASRIIDLLASKLADRTLLLVLDNCERLVSACAQVADVLLTGCPKVRLLVTSREPLQIAGEITWRVPPLAVPDPQQATSFDQLAGSPAVRLFVDRAQAVLPGFTLTPQNAPTIVKICRRLDGLPLGIELAAARLRTLGVEEILERLNTSFRVLVGSPRSGPDRHQTMRATLDWSHALLTPHEQATFRRLAAPGGPGSSRRPVRAEDGGDPAGADGWPEIHERCVIYLERHVVGTVWADHLTLAAAVLAARRMDVQIVTTRLRVLHTVFRELLPALGLDDLAQWDPDRHLPAYLQGDVLPHHSPYRRAIFRSDYSAVTGHLRAWLRSLPPADQAAYRPLVLPPPHPWSIQGLAQQDEVRREGQAARKAEVAALLPHFLDLRAQAHLRFNRLRRLRHAYQAAIAAVADDRADLPFAFSYEEGGDPTSSVPHRERLHFRLWDRRSFVLHHQAAYGKYVLADARLRRRGFADDHNGFYLELVRSESLDGSPPDALWFVDLVRLGLLGRGPADGTPEEVAAKQAWLRAWGYGEKGIGPCQPFQVPHAGLLTLSNADRCGDGQFTTIAQQRAEGVLLPVEPLYAAALFGLLAVELFSTTGMRINEAMQVRMARDCYVEMDVPGPPGAADRRPTRKWFFRLIPKGERTDRPRDYHVDEETRKVVARVVWYLAKEHYALPGDEGLPLVPFATGNARAHRFGGRAPYLFQYGRRALEAESITACLRFLLHGLVLATADGRPVRFSSHHFRHLVGTYLLQVEEVPLDIVAELLGHADWRVTAYYSKAPPSVVHERMASFLSRFATYINLGEALARAPAEVQRQLDEAAGRIGTLNRVKGGRCVQPGFCPAKSACIGCPCKAPEPEQRAEVERERAWASAQHGMAVRDGRTLDRRRRQTALHSAGWFGGCDGRAACGWWRGSRQR